jgi:hypothetical protein
MQIGVADAAEKDFHFDVCWTWVSALDRERSKS